MSLANPKKGKKKPNSISIVTNGTDKATKRNNLISPFRMWLFRRAFHPDRRWPQVWKDAEDEELKLISGAHYVSMIILSALLFPIHIYNTNE